MTKEELAAKLNGREYPFEMNIAEITEAKKSRTGDRHERSPKYPQKRRNRRRTLNASGFKKITR